LVGFVVDDQRGDVGELGGDPLQVADELFENRLVLLDDCDASWDPM
jgi:hypothetical protein